ncbi:ankyrin repeat domain-containing protein 34A-like [Coturnix japonica]|uniref:ankyrin repeat domain-containing protein 34A-like n=1 Tax=Coturnix japonica TaxID=93934 RepID=UPI00077742B7|nr:ankyrin repeat domain-containing protein 34A-like [Coturnix japonica]
MFPCEVPALHRAVSSGRFRLVRLLLEGGASVNDPDPRGRTALMAACGATYGDPSDRTRMVRYLLSRGADPNAADRAGMTALMVACNERAGPGVAALLLEHGADPGTTDRFGSSALFYAARGGDRDTLQELLDASEARGRQVIIITTATSPSGTKTTRQYRHTAPPEPAPEPEPAASPSDVELRSAASPPEGGTDGDEQRVFRFPPHEPNRYRQLQRLHSEPNGSDGRDTDGTATHNGDPPPTQRPPRPLRTPTRPGSPPPVPTRRGPGLLLRRGSGPLLLTETPGMGRAAPPPHTRCCPPSTRPPHNTKDGDTRCRARSGAEMGGGCEGPQEGSHRDPMETPKGPQNDHRGTPWRPQRDPRMITGGPHSDTMRAPK